METIPRPAPVLTLLLAALAIIVLIVLFRRDYRSAALRILREPG